MIRFSCALPPSSEVVELGCLAERLGYHRVWCYDSPALYGDVWMALARLADHTTRIGLGPAVLVPSLRHPMTTASCIAGLVDQAPGRVAVAIGTGFTGRLALGRRPLPWHEVEAYVQVVRALLRGETVPFEGPNIRMLQSPGYVGSRPVDVPILVGADGPKGIATARAVGDGVISAGKPITGAEFAHTAVMRFGTVLSEGEPPSSDRVLSAVGPGVLLRYHAAYALRGAEAVRELPGGSQWLDIVDQTPPASRHLAVHEGHVTEINEADNVLLDHIRERLARHTLTGTASEIGGLIDELAAAGITEVVFQPGGSDIRGELTRMAAAADLQATDDAPPLPDDRCRA